MEKKIKNLGVMVDCSRDACYKAEAVENFIDVIARLGYNVLMLYTEDTYALDGEPYFGYMRGREGARGGTYSLYPDACPSRCGDPLAGIRGKMRGRKRYSSRRSA